MNNSNDETRMTTKLRRQRSKDGAVTQGSRDGPQGSAKGSAGGLSAAAGVVTNPLLAATTADGTKTADGYFVGGLHSDPLVAGLLNAGFTRVVGVEDVIGVFDPDEEDEEDDASHAHRGPVAQGGSVAQPDAHAPKLPSFASPGGELSSSAGGYRPPDPNAVARFMPLGSPGQSGGRIAGPWDNVDAVDNSADVSQWVTKLHQARASSSAQTTINPLAATSVPLQRSSSANGAVLKRRAKGTGSTREAPAGPAGSKRGLLGVPLLRRSRTLASAISADPETPEHLKREPSRGWGWLWESRGHEDDEDTGRAGPSAPAPAVAANPLRAGEADGAAEGAGSSAAATFERYIAPSLPTLRSAEPELPESRYQLLPLAPPVMATPPGLRAHLPPPQTPSPDHQAPSARQSLIVDHGSSRFEVSHDHVRVLPRPSSESASSAALNPFHAVLRSAEVAASVPQVGPRPVSGNPLPPPTTAPAPAPAPVPVSSLVPVVEGYVLLDEVPEVQPLSPSIAPRPPSEVMVRGIDLTVTSPTHGIAPARSASGSQADRSSVSISPVWSAFQALQAQKLAQFGSGRSNHAS